MRSCRSPLLCSCWRAHWHALIQDELRAHRMLVLTVSMLLSVLVLLRTVFSMCLTYEEEKLGVESSAGASGGFCLSREIVMTWCTVKVLVCCHALTLSKFVMLVYTCAWHIYGLQKSIRDCLMWLTVTSIKCFYRGISALHSIGAQSLQMVA